MVAHRDVGTGLARHGRFGSRTISGASGTCLKTAGHYTARPHSDAPVSHSPRRLTTTTDPSIHCILLHLSVNTASWITQDWTCSDSHCTRVLRSLCRSPPAVLPPERQPRQDVPHQYVHMTDHRRISAITSPSIPPAPPPPPPKIKSRSYFERFVAQPLQSAAYASRPPSVQTNRPDGGPLNPLVPKLLG